MSFLKVYVKAKILLKLMSSLITLCITSVALVPLKGGELKTIIYKTMPRDQMSHFYEYFFMST